MVLRRLFCLFFLLGLCACAPRPGPELFLPVHSPAGEGARRLDLLVATDRTPDARHPGNFTAVRAQKLSFARYAVSVPPNHVPTRIEWTGGPHVDPAKSFAVLSYTPLDAEQFARLVAGGSPAATTSPTAAAAAALDAVSAPKALTAPKASPAPHAVPAPKASQASATPKAAETRAPTAAAQALGSAAPRAGASAVPAASAAARKVGAGRRDAAIFIHGYNNTYAESVLRAAQLLADNPVHGPAVLFAWPSDGSLADYVADKDAATVARDHLARFLILLAQARPAGGITLVAHSMGCWLTMETLRQLRLTGRTDVLDRLTAVVLAAPDIDLDVFREQVAAVGRLRHPITVLTSTDDHALEISSRLGGDRYRLGRLDVRDPRIQTLAEKYDIQLIDISNVAATDSMNHDAFVGATNALRAALGPRPSANPLRRAGAYFLDVMASVLEVPGRIGRAAADGVR